MMSTFYGCTNLSGTILIKSPEVGSAYLGGAKQNAFWRAFTGINKDLIIMVPEDSMTYEHINWEISPLDENIIIETYQIE